MDEIECIKYMLNNFKTHKRMLKEAYKSINIKDELYSYIRYEIREYTRFIVSLKRMLESRTKRISGINNPLVDFADTVVRNINNGKEELTKFLTEASKINILDIQRIKKEYKIKSKTLIKLMDRYCFFEQNNIDNISRITNIV